jgi:hypothetical protein
MPAQRIDAYNFAVPNTEPCGFWQDLSLPLPLPEEQVLALCKIAMRITNSPFATSGVIAIFTGSDAAGKLMAADALAYETQHPLYRVDKSEISESSAQLLRILNTGRSKNAILMFDNADDFPKAILQTLQEQPGVFILTMDSTENALATLCTSQLHIVDFPFPSDNE